MKDWKTMIFTNEISGDVLVMDTSCYEGYVCLCVCVWGGGTAASIFFFLWLLKQRLQVGFSFSSFFIVVGHGPFFSPPRVQEVLGAYSAFMVAQSPQHLSLLQKREKRRK
jgi:hypothetical protein